MSKGNGQSLNFLLHSAENISAMVFGLIGAAMVARVFGPENLGRLSLVQAASAIFVFLATLGLDHFIVRDFSLNRKDGELKGSILFAQSIGWLLYVISLAIFFAFRGTLVDEVFLITSVAVSTYFLRVLFFKLYLQAINDAYALAVAAVISRAVALLFLILGSVLDWGYDLMVFYLPLQAIIQAGILFYSYRRTEGGRAKSTISGQRLRSMLLEALPVMLSGALYFGYSQADILVLSHFMNTRDVGIYSAAMRLVPQAAFLGHVTAITFYGSLSETFQMDRAEFLRRAVKVARIQYALAAVLSTSVALLAPLVIWSLYGHKYAGSAEILAIGVWAWLFMLPACLFSRLLILARLAKYELIKAIVVTPLSLGLNILLIPRYGMTAGALVSVLTYALSDFLIYGLFKETRFIFFIGVDALTSLLKSPLISLAESADLFRKKS